MKTRLLFFLSLVLLMTSCSNEMGVSDEFILETNSEQSNSNEMYLIKKDLNQIDSSISLNEDLRYLLAAEIDNEPEMVSLKSSVSQLFDPDNNFCTLPGEVTKKLRNLRSTNKSWAPAFVKRAIKDYPDSALFLPRRSISVLLHSIKIKSSNGNIRDWIVLGAPTFNNLNVDRYILKKGYNSFFYSLDCSGYLNAAIEAAGGIAIADIRTSAKAALEQKKSLFIGGGVLISPISAAYYGSSVGVELDSIERIQILKQVESIPNILETDSIIILSSFDAIWMSLEGSSSFNGEANFGGDARIGIGVAKFSSSGETGATLTRNTSFNSYNTYFTKRRMIPELPPFTIKKVAETRKSLEEVTKSN